MTPTEINTLYDDLAQTPQNTATQATTQLGQSQATSGSSLAAMGASGGNGIGSYTYNRVIDPTVNQLATQLTTAGRSQALNRAIALAEAQAQNNYNRAYNNYSNRRSSGGTGNTTSEAGNGTITGVNENVVSEDVPSSNVTSDVRLNYDKNGNLISGSLPGTQQDFDAEAIRKQQLAQQAAEAQKKANQETWQKQHPFEALPDFLK